VYKFNSTPNLEIASRNVFWSKELPVTFVMGNLMKCIKGEMQKAGWTSSSVCLKDKAQIYILGISISQILHGLYLYFKNSSFI
jgi:hypothetical protein